MSDLKRQYFEKLGQVAYEAYCGEVGWKSVRGEPLPTFKEQAPKIRESWIFAARAVYKQVTKDWGQEDVIQENPTVGL